MTQIKTIANRKYLKVELIKLIQKGKHFYVGSVPTRHFLDLYTVEPAEYNVNKHIELFNTFKDDEEYYKYLIEQDEEKIKEKPFQRKEKGERVAEIKKFLNTEEFAMFPNSIIATCDLLNNELDIDSTDEFDEAVVSELHEKNNLSFLQTKDDKTYLYIPYLPNSILIIDGQHRVKGLGKANDDVKNNFDLLVSFIIEYGRSTLAKLFYTINYTQKSVNKSILYHLMGEFSYDINEITFMHEVVKILNELDTSPFFKRVKMLGEIPKGLDVEEKKVMTISQAFLIDYLKQSISKSAINSIHQPIFLYYYKNRDSHIDIIRFIIHYFKAIKDKKQQDWDDLENSIICKTISIGAFIRVMHFLYIKMFYDEYMSKPDEIISISAEDLGNKLNGIENINFSKDGEFGGVASAGSLNKLKKSIIENMSYFGEDNYDNFYDTFKKNYLGKFKKWNSQYT